MIFADHPGEAASRNFVAPKCAKVLAYGLALLHVTHDEKGAFVLNRPKQSQHGKEVFGLLCKLPATFVRNGQRLQRKLRRRHAHKNEIRVANLRSLNSKPTLPLRI